MRIVLLPSSFAPHIGGIEEVTRQLAKHLVARGEVVEVWTHRHPATLRSAETIDGVRVRRFRFPLPTARAAALLRWPFAAASAESSFLRALRRFGPDLVHVHGFSGNGVYAAASCGLAGVPMLITLHGETSMDDQNIYGTSMSLRAGLRFGLGRAAVVTAPSDFILQDAVRFGLVLEHARVIPNGVDLLETPDETKVVMPFERSVLALGRLVPNKGFDLLLRSFAIVAADRPELGLVIAGDGPQRHNLGVLARELGLSGRVMFAGWQGRSEVSALMARATVLALPSRLEPFGVVALEAMRTGLPVVASSRGGVGGWASHGRDLWLADPEDTDEFARALSVVLDDPSLAESLADAGRRHVAVFAWSIVGERYRQLYAEVLAH